MIIAIILLIIIVLMGSLTRNRNIAVLALIYGIIMCQITMKAESPLLLIFVVLLPLILSCFPRVEAVAAGVFVFLIIQEQFHLPGDAKHVIPGILICVAVLLILRCFKQLYWITSILICAVYVAVNYSIIGNALGTEFDLFWKVAACAATFAVTMILHRYSWNRVYGNASFADSFHITEEDAFIYMTLDD